MNVTEHIETAESLLSNAHQGNTANERLVIALLAIGHALVANAKKPNSNIVHTIG